MNNNVAKKLKKINRIRVTTKEIDFIEFYRNNVYRHLENGI